MKKLFSILTLAVTIAMATGCAKYTDIEPKGQNLLNRATDLDLLMNVEFRGNAFGSTRQALLDNDMYLVADNVPNAIASNVLTMGKVLLTYNETANRASLTLTDGPYEGMYRIISTVPNVVITNAEKASGDPALVNRLKAEAYILRAFLHYRLVNIYAKAYDPASAAADGGIPYVTDINFEEVNSKKTVKEVYDNILADLNTGISMGTLPDVPKNNMRIGKAFAYGVKASVLMSMRDYSGALEAANTALAINSTLEDHRPLMSLPRASRILTRNGLTAPDNIFYACADVIDPSLFAPTYEILNGVYEPGNIIKDQTDTYNYQFGQLYIGLPNIPIFLATTYQANSAGMTTSDLTLIKAECLIRSNRISEGMDEINKIRIRRMDPYTAITATSEAQAIAQLQKTSRIELLFTIRNFINIKRWNKEGKYPVIVERTINGTKYTLQPNSPLWVFPFPQSATQFNPTLTQNY